MKKPMRKGMTFLMAAALPTALAVCAGAAKASHVCAYVNDNLSAPNATEGYMVGPGSGVAHVGPYYTNGSGANGSTGGHAAARVRESDLYVDNAGSRDITHFKINKADCTLRLDTTLYPTGDTGRGVAAGDSLAITPDGRTMFAGSTVERRIYSHAIAADGSLGPPVIEALPSDYAEYIAVSPDGRTLVISNPDIFEVCAYPISAGHLDTPNCRRTASNPEGVSIDPDSACVYAAEDTFNGVSEIAAFTLTESILGSATDYYAFGPGATADSILVNWDNKAIYVTNRNARMSIGTIRSGCNLTYKTSISDGVGAHDPAQIAQGKIAHGYVVSGDNPYDYALPSMGIFRAYADGSLAHVGAGTGQFPLMSGASPSSIVVVGSE